MTYIFKRKKETLLYIFICFLSAIFIVTNSLMVSYIVANSKLGNGNVFSSMVCGVFIYMIFQSLGFFLQAFFSSKLRIKLREDLRQDLLVHIMKAPSLNPSHEQLGAFKTSLTTYIEAIDSNYFENILWGIYLVIQCLVAIVLASYLHFVFVPLILLFSLPPVAIPYLFRRKIEKGREKVLGKLESVTTTGLDVIEGNKTIKLYRSQAEMMKQIQEKSEALIQTEVAFARLNARVDFGSRFFSNFLFFGVWLFGAYFVMHGKMSLAEVIAFTELSGSISVPLNLFLDIYTRYMSGKKTYDYLRKQMESEVTQEDNIHTCLENIKETGIQTICFENVTYQQAEKKILSAVHLILDTKKKYVLTGPSGIGKSTLVECLFDRKKVYDGQILVNGIDRKWIDDQVLYQRIGYLSQQGYIFKGTIRENVSLFKTITDDQKIIDLLHYVGLSAWFADKTLDTQISNTNTALSGGERQRLLLARLLYEDSDFLIVDEISSSLDPDTTQNVETLLLNLDIGVLLISHNLTEENKGKFEQIPLFQTMKEDLK